jgi:GMP synthase (glutamine-hydrolysing)
MILLVDLGYRPDSLPRDEFVNPVARIVEGAGISWRYRHYSGFNKEELPGICGIILCGTALKDNGFLEHPERFTCLLESPVPVLGICAGMQVLCQVFDGVVQEGSEIGMTNIRVCRPDPILPDRDSFQAYELHSRACDPPPGWITLAVSDAYVQAVRHPGRPYFGVMFHPEVRNEHVVEGFLGICRKKP